MKLVNPAGRTIEALDVQANYRNCACVCSNNYPQQTEYQPCNDYNPSNPACACECSYGSANSSANSNMAYNEAAH
ncbi:hypothetical protein IAI10_01490 [Clostridium sp. 19966]|uniref:hypothetical protein n=1 Tax=Clostridium sp. 19966 TaxID=2768166 RepID=UPI0028DEA136|nr:hypothetical protein [Clostridium sp. 19966]MDT8715349.1 hypothetical protein [Clostridium sp. 19966]